MSQVFNYQKLFRAYLDCRKTKRKTINALKFEMDLEQKLTILLSELRSRKYQPGRSTCFVVVNPTVREIFAADFRDRIVHHLLINEIEQMGEDSFIYDSYACRKDKGTHKAVERLGAYLKKVSKNNTHESWYAQLDISGFFMSINHDRLYVFFESLILRQNKSQQWKDDLLWLVRVIIYHRPASNYRMKGDAELFKLVPREKSLFGAAVKRGLPIGNYSSQFSGNLYLNSLDHFIKRELKCRYYVRYVDDLVLLGGSKEELSDLAAKIEQYLIANLAMMLKQSKTKIRPIEQGIDFLGYFIKPCYNLVRKRVVKTLKDKLDCCKIDSKDNRLSAEKAKNILPMINSYYGHFRKANSYNLRQDIFLNHLGGIRNEFELKDRGVALKLASHS